MENCGTRRQDRKASYKEEKGNTATVWRLEKRKPRKEEAPGEICYDLIGESADGVCLLEDVSRSARLARSLLRLFKKEDVTTLEAPYILEDLMACPEWLD